MESRLEYLFFFFFFFVSGIPVLVVKVGGGREGTMRIPTMRCISCYRNLLAHKPLTHSCTLSFSFLPFLRNVASHKHDNLSLVCRRFFFFFSSFLLLTFSSLLLFPLPPEPSLTVNLSPPPPTNPNQYPNKPAKKNPTGTLYV